ncbi:hypothetical protein PT974_02176 [Cladobotryum mycophilum]|uniref:Uncharacterized protein n=1 Tax=Cladobotryum mycophilum TaxID=491253 RepID=A0ABR0SYN3_9HYPO
MPLYEKRIPDVSTSEANPEQTDEDDLYDSPEEEQIKQELKLRKRKRQFEEQSDQNLADGLRHGCSLSETGFEARRPGSIAKTCTLISLESLEILIDKLNAIPPLRHMAVRDLINVLKDYREGCPKASHRTADDIEQHIATAKERVEYGW